jgi:hypothetical protein
MGRIIRVRVNWTGLIGGNGYTNLHFEPTVESDPWTQPLVDAAVTKVQTFMTSVRPFLPVFVVTGVDAQVSELEETSGTIQSFWTATPTAPAPGTSAVGPHSSTTGACVNWSTGGVRNGRRVRGRTFIVPLGSAGLGTDGTILDTALTTLRTAATTLTSDANGVRLVVWVRPNPVIPIDGGAYDVVSSSISDRTAILTSRRG